MPNSHMCRFLNLLRAHTSSIYLYSLFHKRNSSKRKQQQNSTEMCQEICKSCEWGGSPPRRKIGAVHVETGASKRPGLWVCSGEYGTSGITETRGHSSSVYSVAEKQSRHSGKPGDGRCKERETETDSQHSVRNSTGGLVGFRLDSNIGGRFTKGILRCSQ